METCIGLPNLRRRWKWSTSHDRWSRMTTSAFAFRLSLPRNLINTFSDGVRGWFYMTTGQTLGYHTELTFQAYIVALVSYDPRLGIELFFFIKQFASMVTGTFRCSKCSLRAFLLKLECTFEYVLDALYTRPHAIKKTEALRLSHFSQLMDQSWSIKRFWNTSKQWTHNM